MEAPKGIEQEVLRPAQSLRILVHPSFLIGSPPHSLKHNTDHYKDMTKAMQQNALQRFLPTQENDVLLIMPLETPTLQSWRDSRDAKRFCCRK